jgi:hypothetical protein
LKLTDIHDEKDLIAFGNDYFERSAKDKRTTEQKWLLNIAFIAGDQLVNVNRVTGSLDRVRVEYDPPWVVRIVDNRIKPIYRLMLSKLTKNKPLPSAKAHSREESDIQAARAAVKLEENHWDTLNLDTIHPELASWLIATGNGLYKQFWNPKKGDRLVDTGEEEQLGTLENMDTEAGLTPEGLPQPKPAEKRKPVSFNLGDTDLLFRSPFNVYPEPGKTKLRDMKLFGDADFMDVDEIEASYGKKVEPEKDTKYVKIHHTLSQTVEAGSVETVDQPENSVVVKELYVLPCAKFPKGFVLRWAREVILFAEEGCSELPFVHFGLIEIPGRFWYSSIVDDLIPLQKRWNQLLSKIEMHNDYYNDPPTIVDPNVIDIDDWSTEPGLLLESKQPGANLQQAAHVLQVPQLDQAIFKELEILDSQFEIVPVMNKVSYGKDTPNAKSGIAINFLQEKDDDVVRPIIDQIEAGYAQVFKRDFKLCQDNYEEDRGFAIVGEDNKVEWVEFKKADLNSNIDVGVEPGSAMPRSKVAQQAMVMDMLKAGFFTNPQTGQPDFPKAMKYMEFGSVDDIYQDNALDSNQAKRESEGMKEGKPAVAEDWHNHEAHIYEHNRVRKTADYETYPDEAKVLFADHIAQHLMFMQPPAPAQQQQAAPSVEELFAFVRQLPSDIQAQVAQLPPEQQLAAVVQLYSQAGQAQQNMEV